MVRSGSPGTRLLATSISTLLLLSLACKDSGVTAARVEQDLRKAIPVGTTKEQVLQFLSDYQANGLKFEPAEYVDSVLDDYDIENMREDEFSPAVREKPNKETKGFIITYIKEVTRQVVVAGHIGVMFYFDKDGRVIDYSVEKYASD